MRTSRKICSAGVDMSRGYFGIIETFRHNRCIIWMYWYSWQSLENLTHPLKAFLVELLIFIWSCFRFHREIGRNLKMDYFDKSPVERKRIWWPHIFLNRYYKIYFQGYKISKNEQNSWTTSIFFKLTKVKSVWEKT